MKISKLVRSILLGLAAIGMSKAAHAQEHDSQCAPFETTGTGPDLVLIPGLGSSPEVWNDVVERLSEEYRVHLVHVPGFAGRPANGNPATLFDRAASEILSQLECNDADSAILVGHSLGGFLGLKMASESPEHVERLVIVDALPFYPLIFSPAATVEGVRPQAEGVRAQLLAASNSAFEANQRSGARSLVQTASYQETLVNWSIASDRATFAEAVYTLMTTDLRPALDMIATPTTVIAASNRFAPRARVEPLFQNAYAELKDVDIRIVEDSYHFVMIDQSDVFKAELLRALGSDD